MGAGQKVLVLDNHDDFGGHAKRNEFVVNGKTIVCNGGTLNIESPGRYNPLGALGAEDIGLDLARFRTANSANRHLYADFGLAGAYAFDRETFGKATGGKDMVVRLPKEHFWGFNPDVIDKAPIGAAAKAALHRLTSNSPPDYLEGLSVVQKKDWLARHSFREFLIEKAGIGEEGYWFFQLMGCGTFCVGADATPALFGWVQGYPALRAWVWAKFPMACSPTFPAASTDARRKEMAMSTSPTATRPWPAR
jgi:spermidine dehydrogenase